MQANLLKRVSYLVLSLVLIVGLSAVIAVYAYSMNDGGSASVDAAVEPPAANDTADEGLTSPPTQDTNEAEFRASARADTHRLSQKAVEARGRIADLRTEITAWNNDIVPLLNNNPAASMAANQDFVTVFRVILNDPGRAPTDTPDRLETRLISLVEPIEKLGESEANYAQREPVEAELDDLVASAAAALQSYREPRQQIQSMLTAIIRQSNAKPVPASDETTTADLPEHPAPVQPQAVATAVAEERRKAQQALAQLEAERVRHEAALELQRRRLAEEIRQKDAERELALEREDRQRSAAATAIADKKRRAADPTVQAKYQPFLAKGRFEFHPPGDREHKPEGYRIAQPASFRRLRECGVLNNAAVFWKTGAGLYGRWRKMFKTLYYVPDKDGFASQGYQNDRPTWSGTPTTEAQWREAEARFQEFLDLAPYWIEMGALQP